MSSMAALGKKAPAINAAPASSDEEYLEKKAPSGKEVAWFHREADTDASELAAHHTLGNDQNQAAKGNHTHDGRNGRKLFGDGDAVTGTKYASGGPSAGDLTNLQNQINALTALVVKLGASDRRA